MQLTRNNLSEDAEIKNTPSMFGKFYRRVVKQRRVLNVLLISLAASATIYGMLLASGLNTLDTNEVVRMPTYTRVDLQGLNTLDTNEEVTRRTYTRVDLKDRFKSSDERYDVLINSYMRSGSTITGHLLGHRDDVFFFYEPLRPYYRMSYFKGRDSVCKYLEPQCKLTFTSHLTIVSHVGTKPMLPGHLPSLFEAYRSLFIIKTSGPIFKIDVALAFLKAIYNCSFDTSDAMKRTISRVGLNMYRKSGASWDVFLDCWQKNKTTDCISKLIPWCKKAKHRVTKVLRLSLDNTEMLLRENPRLKVIHLLRDPRGVLNSQIHTGWFPFSEKSQDAVRNNAMGLCSRMLHDIESGKRLIQLYPNRVKLIHYEDFNDTVELAEYLYSFFGMEFNEKYKKHATTSDTISATKKKDGYHQFSYRNSLSWLTVENIDSVCADLYRESGYRRFDTEDDLRNSNVSAIQTRLTFSHLNLR